MQRLGERSEKNTRETTLQTPRAGRKERERVLQALEQRFPTRPRRLSSCRPRRSTVEQFCTLQPQVRIGAYVLKEAAACGEPTQEQAPGRSCRPRRGAHARAGFLAGPVTPWRTHAGAACSWRTAPHGKDARWSSSWRAAARGRNPMLEPANSMRRKEQQRVNVANWPQPSIPIALRCLQEGGRSVGSEVEPGKQGEKPF